MRKILSLLILFLFLTACTAPARTVEPTLLPDRQPTKPPPASLAGQAPADTALPTPTAKPSPTPGATRTPVPAGPTLRHELRGLESPVIAVSLSGQKRWLAVLTQHPAAVSIWDYSTGKLVRSIQVAPDGSETTLAFQPGSTLLATGGGDGPVSLWDIETGEQVLELDGPDREDWPSALAFSADGGRLAVGYYQSVRVFELPGGQLTGEIHSPFLGTRVSSLSFSPEGSQLAIGAEQGPAVVWDLTKDQAGQVLPVSYNSASVAFSPDGMLLAVAGMAAPVLLWETGAWTQYARIPDFTTSGANPVVAFSPDGSLLAISAGDGEQHVAHLYDTASLEKVAALEKHTDMIVSLAFAPDQNLLATGAYDQTAVVWDVSQVRRPVGAAVVSPTAVLDTLRYEFPQPIQSGQPVALDQLFMVDLQSGWATAWDGVYGRSDRARHLLHTSDGGATWQEAVLPDGVKLYSSYYLDAETAWVVAPVEKRTWEGGAAYTSIATWQTTNGGQTWQQGQPVALAYTELAKEVRYFRAFLQFLDPRNGWMLVSVNCDYYKTCAWQVYQTGDGGITWTRIHLAEGTMASMVVWDRNHAWAAEDIVVGWVSYSEWNASLWATTDGGYTWQTTPVPPPENLPEGLKYPGLECAASKVTRISSQAAGLIINCIVYIDTHPRYQFYHLTPDQGQTWYAWESNGSEHFVSGTTGWRMLSGSPMEPTRLQQTSDSGDTWTDISSLAWSGSLDFVSEQAGWALARLGDATALLYSEDGGKTWIPMAPVVSGP